MCLVKIFVIFFRNITLIRLTLFYFIFFDWHLGTLSTVQCGVVKFTNFSLTLRYIVGFACFGRVTICFLVVLSGKLLKWHLTVILLSTVIFKVPVARHRTRPRIECRTVEGTSNGTTVTSLTIATVEGATIVVATMTTRKQCWTARTCPAPT